MLKKEVEKMTHFLMRFFTLDTKPKVITARLKNIQYRCCTALVAMHAGHDATGFDVRAAGVIGDAFAHQEQRRFNGTSA